MPVMRAIQLSTHPASEGPLAVPPMSSSDSEGTNTRCGGRSTSDTSRRGLAGSPVGSITQSSSCSAVVMAAMRPRARMPSRWSWYERHDGAPRGMPSTCLVAAVSCTARRPPCSTATQRSATADAKLSSNVSASQGSGMRQAKRPRAAHPSVSAAKSFTVALAAPSTQCASLIASETVRVKPAIAWERHVSANTPGSTASSMIRMRSSSSGASTGNIALRKELYLAATSVRAQTCRRSSWASACSPFRDGTVGTPSASRWRDSRSA
mmetsp:Transcript_11599/g.38347  ORF Transcript_11599/g.38347 Transcript_11599/m.38347 type:complete len:266 (-) Transcript_11599:274-1071(-)